MSFQLFRSFFHTLRVRAPALLLIAGCINPFAVMAQADAPFPGKQGKVIVTFPPGGAGDLIGRTIAKGLQGIWNQTVIVENQPGASGSIGAEQTMRANADGSTLFLASPGVLTVLPFMREKLPFDPLVDLVPIAMTVVIPNILVVGAQSQHKTFKDLVAAAKAKPGALDYASSGRGESHHMMMEYMMKATGTKLNEIPYKGGAPALQAVLSGEVQAAWIAVSTAMPFLKSGQLIGLAVSTEERVMQVPNIPSVAEQGFPGFNFSFWMGIMGPAKMSPALIKRIETDVQTVVRSAEYRELIGKTGNLPIFESSDQFSKTIRETYARNKATLVP